MNIKGFIANILPSTEVRHVDGIGKTIKSDQTNDRDANGQESYSSQEEHRERMSDEQFEAALEHLRKLPATKEHRWTVSSLTHEGNRFAIVKDNLGNIIRQIPELDLWTLPSEDSPRGQLLKRTA